MTAGAGITVAAAKAEAVLAALALWHAECRVPPPGAGSVSAAELG